MPDKNHARRSGSTLLRAALVLGVVAVPACESMPTDVALSSAPSFALAAGEQEVAWDFRTIPFASVGGVSTAVGASTTPVVTASISQTCGGPAEHFGPEVGPVHLTRVFGEFACYPFLSVTTTAPVELNALTFYHVHNHNPGFPTYSEYRAQMQINTGAGWMNIGNDVELSGATNYSEATVDLGGQSVSGSFQLRWIPTNLAYGNNTGSEFFALYDVALTVGLNPADKDACKNGGWSQYGFRNQGQCVAYVNTGNDSR